ncbi:MAG: hypothetical protein ACOC3G_03775 [Phycisphaeraceae bacterium]
MSTDAKKDRPNLASGKLLLIATLSLFIIVPAVLAVLVPWVKRDLEQTPRTLPWSDRQEWEPLPVSPKNLERGMMSAARTDEKYEDYGFHIPGEAELELMELSRLAHGSEGFPAFTSAEARERIEQGRQTLDDRFDFYPEFLLAKWHELQGNDERAMRLYEQSFAHAQAALMRKYVNPEGDPVEGHDAGKIIIGFDQVENDKINTNLRLTYPHLKTDALGRVYLPVFKTIYRIERRDDLTQPPPVRRDWFVMPGQLGELQRVTVQPD